MIVKGNHKLRECLNLNQIKTESIAHDKFRY